MRQHLERARRAGRRRQRTVLQQLFIDANFLGHPQAIGHLDDVHPIEKSLVVLVVAERLPLGLVGVRENGALEGQRGEALGTVVVAFLGRGQQRVQHLDRRLEHLDEFHQALVGAAQRARVTVGIGIVLRVMLEHADVDLADQRRDILVVLIAGLGLGDRDLVEDRRLHLDHLELRDIAAVLVEALDRPRRHDLVQVAPGDTIVLFENLRVLVDVEQSQRGFEHRRILDRVDRPGFHQQLEAVGKRGLTAADRAQQVEDLFLFLQALRRVLEIGDDLLDRLLHAVELGKRRVAGYHLVGKDAAESRLLRGIDQFGFADRGQHALGGGRIDQWIVLAHLEVFLQRVFFLQVLLEALLIGFENAH